MDPKTGLYSKAAKIVRGYPGEKGTAEQMIAFAKKAGVKPAELEQAKPPTGPITREELAQHFERNVPKIKVEQYGENPSYMKPGELGRLQSMSYSYGAGRRVPREGLTPEELSDYHVLSQKKHAQPDVMEDDSTLYDEYTLDNGENYRERLLRLNQSEPQYHSSHWRGHPDVLAHIRLSDRSVGPTADFASAKAWVQPVVKEIAEHMGVKPSELGSGAAKYAVQNGMITPEEAATLTKIRGWQNEFTDQPGIGNKRLLHVEELQSDWAQEGRDKGFYDPAKPHQVFDWEGRKPLANYATEEEALEHIRSLPEGADVALRDMSTTKRPDMPPVAPYVGNTQHWTDLALKNVLREAALGNYDGVVFTPGQAQADRYGLEKHVGKLQLLNAPGSTSLGVLNAWTPDGKKAFSQEIADENALHQMVGRETGQKLLSQPKTNAPPWFSEGSTHRVLEGEDLKVGGQGMKGFYDNIVPKSVMRLAQMHDPDIKPGEPVDLPQGYQGFHLPMTDKLRQGILNEGYPAFKRGGKVDAALAATRRFTKDGKGAMMDLKSK